MTGVTSWIAYASLGVSGFAFAVSFVTLWITQLRRGTIEMVRPSQFYLGPDGSRESPLSGPPKIFVRSFLYATSRKGRPIESLWLTVHRGEASQAFNIWVYGSDKLERGAGLFVSDAGLTTSHHFLLPDGDQFQFTEGRYEIEIFANIVGDRHPKVLVNTELQVSPQHAAALKHGDAGLYFDYSPNMGSYVPKIHSPAAAWIASLSSKVAVPDASDALPKNA